MNWQKCLLTWQSSQKREAFTVNTQNKSFQFMLYRSQRLTPILLAFGKNKSVLSENGNR